MTITTDNGAAAPVRVIDVTPTFRATADMLIALFESGTTTGQDFAKAELRRWGDMLDQIKAERASQQENAQ